MMEKNNQEEVRQMLKALSPRDFLNIGMHEVGYVREVDLAGAGKLAYGVYAADGTQLSVLDTMDMAIATMRHNDLLPVTLH